MLLDLNECPLCGGRKTNADFCAACTSEIEGPPGPGVGRTTRTAAAFRILVRNGRMGHYREMAAKQARARLEAKP